MTFTNVDAEGVGGPDTSNSYEVGGTSLSIVVLGFDSAVVESDAVASRAKRDLCQPLSRTGDRTPAQARMDMAIKLAA